MNIVLLSIMLLAAVDGTYWKEKSKYESPYSNVLSSPTSFASKELTTKFKALDPKGLTVVDIRDKAQLGYDSIVVEQDIPEELVSYYTDSLNLKIMVWFRADSTYAQIRESLDRIQPDYVLLNWRAHSSNVSQVIKAVSDSEINPWVLGEAYFMPNGTLSKTPDGSATILNNFVCSPEDLSVAADHHSIPKPWVGVATSDKLAEEYFGSTNFVGSITVYSE